MVKYRKRLLPALLIVFVTVFMISCNKTDKPDSTLDSTPDTTPDSTPEVTVEVTDGDDGLPEEVGKETETNPPIQEETPYGGEELTGADTKEVPIYGANSNTMKKEAMVAHVAKESEITPRLVVNEVIANFQEEIGVSDVVMEGERIVVSFKEGMAPMARVSSSMESVILDCIAYSLLDNFEECSEIVYRGENGGRYESGHIFLEVDEVYVSE